MSSETMTRTFRRRSAVIEYHEPSIWYSTDGGRWLPVTGEVMMTLTPTELRIVAELIECQPGSRICRDEKVDD